MKNDREFWTTQDGERIDVDEMTISHLRAVLKMMLRTRRNSEYRDLLMASTAPPLNDGDYGGMH